MTQRRMIHSCRRRLPALVLFFCLCASLLTVSASAAFSDVKSGAWYYDDVTRLQAAGVISGYPDGSFRPSSAVNYAEALKMILAAAGCPVKTEGAAVWYAPYLSYAEENGIADPDAGLRPDQPISRSRSAELIVRAMGLPLVVEPGESPFADSDNVYAVTLYRAGILKGEQAGKQTYFRGERSLNRAELASLVARMMRYTEAQPAPAETHLLMPAGCTLPDAPKTVEDFVQMLIYLSVNGIDSHTFVYRGVDVETVKNDYLPNLTAAYPIATDLCREAVVYYHYYNINLAYAKNYVAMTVQLRGRDYTADECREMFDYSVEAAEAALAEIRDAGAAAGESSQLDFARRCLEWVVTHCRYVSTDGMLDQYAYSVFRDGASVCSGYTAAYNLLLKLGGVKCMSMTGYATTGGRTAAHAWTIAELDGQRYWIDVTWCDPVGQPDDAVTYTYFALDEATFNRDHVPEWDYAEYWHLLD